jgi:hypothetical protein
MGIRSFSMVATNNRELLESPLVYGPSDQPVWSITIPGTGTLASPTMKLFKGTTDVSSADLTGSMSISGRVVTTKTMYNLVGGSDYAAYIYFTDGGVPTSRYCLFSVQKEGVF